MVRLLFIFGNLFDIYKARAIEERLQRETLNPLGAFVLESFGKPIS
jgi:hypothetical protein